MNTLIAACEKHIENLRKELPNLDIEIISRMDTKAGNEGCIYRVLVMDRSIEIRVDDFDIYAFVTSKEWESLDTFSMAALGGDAFYSRLLNHCLGVKIKWIKISSYTKNEIAKMALFAFKGDGKMLADGSWMIPVDQDIIDALDVRKMDGENYDDVILKAIIEYKGGKLN